MLSTVAAFAFLLPTSEYEPSVLAPSVPFDAENPTKLPSDLVLPLPLNIAGTGVEESVEAVVSAFWGKLNGNFS